MQAFQEAKVIDQIRDISFVMLPGENNQVLSEQDFINKVLPYLGHIEGIELSCLGVSDFLINVLSKNTPHLKNICLFGLDITDATLRNLAKVLPNLTKIHLVNTSVSAKGIQLLVNDFPYLHSLGISGQHLKDSDLLALKEGIRNLYSFSVIGQTFKDMNTIKTLLTAMPKLRTLDLSESNVTDQVAKDIAEVCKTLRRLDISETDITASGVREIVQTLDLDKLKMNRLRGIGPNDLKFIIDKQKGLKTFHFAGASFTNAILMKLILDMTKLTNLTLIPGDSSWTLSEGIAQAIILKKVKLQYLHIQANRLPETLRLEFEKEVPTLRVEYSPDGPVPLNISKKRAT